MSKKNAYLLFLTLIVVSCSGCIRPLRIDGPYEGRVIDAETSQPIEGVVVDATWHRVYPNVAGSSSVYYDTRETLTDKKGEFSIPGQGLLILSTIDKAAITIFKAGYDGIQAGWVALDDKHLWQWHGRVTHEKGRIVIRMKKLTLEERRKRGGPSISGSPPKSKTKLLMMESNKEMIEIGFPESTFYNME